MTIFGLSEKGGGFKPGKGDLEVLTYAGMSAEALVKETYTIASQIYEVVEPYSSTLFGAALMIPAKAADILSSSRARAITTVFSGMGVVAGCIAAGEAYDIVPTEITNNNEVDPTKPQPTGTAVAEMSLDSKPSSVEELFGTQIDRAFVVSDKDGFLRIIVGERDGNIASMVPLYGSEVKYDDTTDILHITGKSEKSTVNMRDVDNDGDVDSIIAIQLTPADVMMLRENSDKLEHAGLTKPFLEFLDHAEAKGLDIETSIILTGNTLSFTLKASDGSTFGYNTEVSEFDSDSSDKVSERLVALALKGGGVQMRVVPADYVELGDQIFVDPSVVSLQESISTSSDLTLVPNEEGTAMNLIVQQEDGTSVVVPGLEVMPNGEVFVDINGERVLADSLSMVDGKLVVVIDGREYKVGDDGIEPLNGEVEVPQYLQDMEWPEIDLDKLGSIDFASLPVIQGSDADSMAYAEAIKVAYERGEFPQFPSDLRHFNFEVTTDSNGFDYVPIYSPVAKVANKPTIIPTLAIIDRGFHPDGTRDLRLSMPQLIHTQTEDGRLAAINFETSMAMGEDNLRQIIRVFLGLDRTVVPMHFETAEACVSYNKGEDGQNFDPYGVCQEYYNNHQEVAEEMIREWVRTGVFPRELSGIPMYPAFAVAGR